MFGVPDAKYGEEVCAWVDRAPRPRARRGGGARLLPGQIAHYKVPRYVRFVDAVPAHGDRQGAEVRDAQGDDGVLGLQAERDRLSVVADPPRDVNAPRNAMEHHSVQPSDADSKATR